MLISPHALRMRLLLAATMLLLPVSAAHAAPQQDNSVPTNIRAQNMQYDAGGQTVVFTGKVYVKRPDFELWSEKMTVYLEQPADTGDTGTASPAGDMEAGEINRIVAERNVVMKSEDKHGTCDKATYYAKDNKFVMEGKPELKDSKRSTARGDVITHYIGTNISDVRNPQITFYAPDKTTGDNGTNK